MVWDGRSSPFLEAYTLKLNHPEQKWALWAQYGLTNCQHDQVFIREAFLSGVFMDHLGHKVAIKHSLGLDQHEILHSDQFISIDGSSLSLAESTGYIMDSKHTLKWDLIFEDPVESFKPLPLAPMYHFSWPKTKFTTPRLKTFATGQIFINHKRKDFSQLPVYQSHHYGRDLVPGWAWANCLQFKEDPTALFEAIAIKTSKKSSSTNSLKMFLLRYDNETYLANSLMDQFGNHSALSANTWDIEFKKAGLRFECRLERLPQLCFGRVILGSGEALLHCYTSLLANITINVYEGSGKNARFVKTLTSQAATFETASRQSLNAYPIDMTTSTSEPIAANDDLPSFER